MEYKSLIEGLPTAMGSNILTARRKKEAIETFSEDLSSYVHHL